jgi:cytochrome b subunit of formate dehydrogenase/nitrate reductase cytochrome c-type subunit
MGVFFVMGIFFQPLAKAVPNPEVLAVEKDKALSTDPRIIAAMKTSMYEQVADDEDIDIMAKWISEGAKNDDFFKKNIYTIIKNDCINCHSKTSTMTKKVPHIPFASYEDVKKFTKVGPTNDSCLECHGNSILNDPANKKFKSQFVDQSKFETTVHQKLSCIRCHVVLHPETDKIYQDTEVFKAYILKGETAVESGRSEIFKPDCANCHPKVGRKIQKSAHSAEQLKIKLEQSYQNTNASLINQTELKAPKCNDCHGPQHYIADTKLNKTKFDTVNRCGTCHEKLIKTYFGSYHGKASKLGSDKVAKCANCHGSHELLSPSVPASMLSDANIQKTCQACHPKANKNFVGFLPHADIQDRVKNPLLFFSFWGMTIIIVFTFALFGTHSILWLNRSIIEKLATQKNKEKTIVPDKVPNRYIRRFRMSYSILHLMIMVSFLTLALTGMALKFADNPVFLFVNQLVGGPSVMGKLHMIGALIALLYISIHLFQVAVLFIKRKITFTGLFKKEYSLMLLPRDFKELKLNLLYFIGKGPKPEFGRWTYWEKFDYLAELWGTIVVAVTGLMLAFPEFFTQFLPGVALNIATIIHSFEALLATAFIFSIHFFNSHLRPENFPMDTVIFTQKLPLSRFKEERPREYQKMVKNQELEKYLVEPPKKWYSIIVSTVGWFFLSIGIITLMAIIYSLLGIVFL